MSQENKYTKPELRERIKDRVMAGSKGGKGEKQKSLEKWGEEKWQTKDEYEKRSKAKSAAKKYKENKQ